MISIITNNTTLITLVQINTKHRHHHNHHHHHGILNNFTYLDTSKQHVQVASIGPLDREYEPNLRMSAGQGKLTQKEIRKTGTLLEALGIQSDSQRMIGLLNHLLSLIFSVRFHDHSEKVSGSLPRGIK